MLPADEDFVIPELPILLNVFIKISAKSTFFAVIKKSKDNKIKKIISKKSSWCSRKKFFLLNTLNIKNKFNIEINIDIIKTNSWVLFLIIWFKELVGKKPPLDTNVMLRFSVLNNLIFEKLNKINIKSESSEYIKNTLSTNFNILFLELLLPSPGYVK